MRSRKRREPKYQGKPLDYWVERLQKAETDKDREAATAVIKQFGPDAAPAVPALIEMLDDHAADFRWMAMEILAKIGPAAKDVVPELVKRLTQKSRSSRNNGKKRRTINSMSQKRRTSLNSAAQKPRQC